MTLYDFLLYWTKMSGCSLIGRVLAYPVLDDAGSNPVTRSKKRMRIKWIIEKFIWELFLKQGGVNNSHFGKHWYTNRNTGECKHFITAPDETWIEGRNLFQGESEKIKFITKQREFYRNLWNKYHSENWECVSKFGEENNIVECRRKFRTWIPYFRNLSNKTKHNRFNFPSNKELIGVYE